MSCCQSSLHVVSYMYNMHGLIITCTVYTCITISYSLQVNPAASVVQGTLHQGAVWKLSDEQLLNTAQVATILFRDS